MAPRSLLSFCAIAFLAAACGSPGPAATGAGVGAGAPTAGSGGAGGTGGAGGGQGGSGGAGGSAMVDLDEDGLDDAWEANLAESYLPFLSVAEDDGCPRGGIVYRVRPHPENAALIHVVYDHLFERDCGLTSHPGDNEAFGATIDPSLPPPAGIRALRAVSHQGTICEKTSVCGACDGLDPCATAPKNGADFPVVFSSKDKHASYVQKDACNPFLSCFDSCSLATASADVPLLNAGEPGKPLVTDLTDGGFINEAQGWTAAELFHYDPWDPAQDFGGAGNVAGDLVDPAFVPPVCP